MDNPIRYHGIKKIADGGNQKEPGEENKNQLQYQI
jgi:hypothetical protein